MFTLIFAEIIYDFKRIWKLYVTNIIAVLLIILLFAYIAGSYRQLNLQKTAFSGEIVVKMHVDEPQLEQTLIAGIPEILYISRKIRTDVQYRLPEINQTGWVELLGINLDSDKNLADYLTLNDGRYLENNKDVLVPTSFKEKTDIKIGDIILVKGNTADKMYNTKPFKVCGFYNSPGLSLFSTPRLLIQYDSMKDFYAPHIEDIEYSLYFKNRVIPDTINKDIRTILKDTDRTKVKSIDTIRVSSFDVINISVQMGVFLNLLIILTIIVVVTVVMLVNFNIHLIIFRKHQKRFGTLMSIGIHSWKIGITLLLESLFQIIISVVIATIIAFLISSLVRQQLSGGFLEVILVLMSGTNRIDFFIQFSQIIIAFGVITTAVIVAQIPIFVKIGLMKPIDVISGR